MLDLLAELRSRNRTIFLTTHYLDEIDLLCDTVGILYGGKLAAELDVQSLRVPGSNVQIRVDLLAAELAEQLQRLPGVRVKGREIGLQPNTPALQAQVLSLLLREGVAIISLEPQGRPLEDFYMRIVRGEPIEQPAEPAPPGLFAPPGHPDRDVLAPELPPAAATGPAELPRDPAPRRSRNGETLLRELLGRRPDSEESEPPK
jgi:hypothetical protein